MNHPLLTLVCKNPLKKYITEKLPLPIELRFDPVMSEYKNKHPAEIGKHITTNCFHNSALLGKFEFEDGNFPDVGTHTRVLIEIMETSAHVRIKSDDTTGFYRFGRNIGYFGVEEAAR